MGLQRRVVGKRILVKIRRQAAQVEAADVILGRRHFHQRTYSKSTGCLLMLKVGGAIQWAKAPREVTRPINEATKARSSSVASQSCCRAAHSASLRTVPSGATLIAASGPI